MTHPSRKTTSPSNSGELNEIAIEVATPQDLSFKVSAKGDPAIVITWVISIALLLGIAIFLVKTW